MIISENTCTSYIRRTLAFGYEIGTKQKSVTYTRVITVCMFIMSKPTVTVCAGGAIWLNPFAMALFIVYCAVTVECCVLYPCYMGVFGMFAVM